MKTAVGIFHKYLRPLILWIGGAFVGWKLPKVDTIITVGDAWVLATALLLLLVWLITTKQGQEIVAKWKWGKKRTWVVVLLGCVILSTCVGFTLMYVGETQSGKTGLQIKLEQLIQDLAKRQSRVWSEYGKLIPKTSEWSTTGDNIKDMQAVMDKWSDISREYNTKEQAEYTAQFHPRVAEMANELNTLHIINDKERDELVGYKSGWDTLTKLENYSVRLDQLMKLVK